MKKISWLLAVALLLVPLYGCAAGGENPPPSSLAESETPESQSEMSEPSVSGGKESSASDGEEEIDRSRIVESDQILYGPPNVDRADVANNHIANSYVIAKSVSYLDHWYREYEVYYPQFTDEIPYGGAAAISQYYAEKAEEEVDTMDGFLWYALTEEVFLDAASELRHYYYQNYSVNYVGKYLAVRYDGDMYVGGAHSMYFSIADNFDMETGALLAAEDVFRTDEESLKLLQTTLAEHADFLPANLPIGDTLNFLFEEEGIRFFFNPYEYGSFADGLREIVIPYEELTPVLAVEVGGS